MKMSEQYKEKLEVIKENYFPKGEEHHKLTEEVENNESEELVEEIDGSNMDVYERLKEIIISNF